jgi:hypothetical protein
MAFKTTVALFAKNKLQILSLQLFEKVNLSINIYVNNDFKAINFKIINEYKSKVDLINKIKIFLRLLRIRN